MSIVETRHGALEGKLSQVIATTAANTKALHELKLMFSKYIIRLKDNSDSSPSVSKSALDSDCPTVFRVVHQISPTQVAMSRREADPDVMENLDTSGEDTNASEGLLDCKSLPQSPSSGPSHAIGVVSLKTHNAPPALQMPNDVVLDKIEGATHKAEPGDCKAISAPLKKVVPPMDPLTDRAARALEASKAKRTKETPLRPTMKDVDRRKGSTKRRQVGGWGHLGRSLVSGSRWASRGIKDVRGNSAKDYYSRSIFEEAKKNAWGLTIKGRSRGHGCRGGTYSG
jgi:hypothetical protein